MADADFRRVEVGVGASQKWRGRWAYAMGKVVNVRHLGMLNLYTLG